MPIRPRGVETAMGIGGGTGILGGIMNGYGGGIINLGGYCISAGLLVRPLRGIGKESL